MVEFGNGVDLTYRHYYSRWRSRSEGSDAAVAGVVAAEPAATAGGFEIEEDEAEAVEVASFAADDADLKVIVRMEG